MNALPPAAHPAAATATAEPVDPAFLATRLRALGVAGSRWAVALSGGPDSLALTALLAALNPQTLALVVDHGLRPESGAEAESAAGSARALGLEARVLRWQGSKPVTGVMEAAREARYRLLLDACGPAGVSHLFLAHHADDQRETVQFRRERGSGWRGLAGMPWLSARGAVWLVRPLLDIGKARLVATCVARGLPFVTDPGNSNPRFARARLRREVLPEPDPAFSRRRQEELARLNALAGDLFTLHENGGYAELQNGWNGHELAEGLLRELLGMVGQREHAPGDEALRRFLRRLQEGAAGGTLAGCRLLRTRSGAFLLVREPAAPPPLSLEPGRHHIWWDRRWLLDVVLEHTAVLAPVGRGSWRGLSGAGFLEEMPGPVRSGLPGLWRQGRLTEVPQGLWHPHFRPLSQIFSCESAPNWQLPANG